MDTGDLSTKDIDMLIKLARESNNPTVRNSLEEFLKIALFTLYQELEDAKQKEKDCNLKLKNILASMRFDEFIEKTYNKEYEYYY